MGGNGDANQSCRYAGGTHLFMCFGHRLSLTLVGAVVNPGVMASPFAVREVLLPRSARAHTVAMAPEPNANRRELERFPVVRSVQLTTSRAGSESFEGTIVDFTERGLRVSTTRQLDNGEQITVHWGHRRLVGTVVHWQLGPTGFVAGISLAAIQ
jgi:hypothetical protein